MALIVEDGTNVANAESYVSEADADTYHTAYGNPTAWSGATSANKEAALRTATRYLDAKYRLRWKGARTNGTQILAWPRADVVDFDDFDLASNVIPQKLKDAASVMALRSIAEDILPDVDNPGDVKSESVNVGPISESTEYVGGRSQLKSYTLVEGLLADLLGAANRLERA